MDQFLPGFEEQVSDFRVNGHMMLEQVWIIQPTAGHPEGCLDSLIKHFLEHV